MLRSCMMCYILEKPTVSGESVCIRPQHIYKPGKFFMLTLDIIDEWDICKEDV